MTHIIDMNEHTQYGYEVERAIVTEIVDRYMQQGMKHVEFARLLYGNDSTAPTKWRRIRNTSPTGKPQGFPVHEAVAAAQILGMDYYSLVFLVEERLKMIRA
ncbi:hypothetical protein GO013_15675 [Pseudodesulfovibrio sp. JC047]|uniref:hypothetical protein n=1 Tax=Pseudodesulfovibrio sp. JC047 TaxID=2683199 RepID=UPI0013D8BA73|nr:hypothetical protein [Pseudodesulfovibrio sp. JC047]NDV20850.1 hypothetical protein [Pseudodesulfovibrio sp. JC047]